MRARGAKSKVCFAGSVTDCTGAKVSKNGNEYVLEDDFPKEKDRDFDEMNPFADQELNNIQKEIDNMEDLDRVDELQEKFSEPYPLRNNFFTK